MPTTPTFNLPYPAATDTPFVHTDLKKLADGVEAAIKSVANGKPVGHMGRTAGFQSVGVPGTTGPVKVQMAAAQILGGGVTFSDADDSLVIPKAGLYRVSSRGYASGGSGYWFDFRAARGSAPIDQTIQRTWKQDAQDYINETSALVRLAAGDLISLMMMMSLSTASTYGTTGYNGAFVSVEWIAE